MALKITEILKKVLKIILNLLKKTPLPQAPPLQRYPRPPPPRVHSLLPPKRPQYRCKKVPSLGTTRLQKLDQKKPIPRSPDHNAPANGPGSDSLLGTLSILAVCMSRPHF